MKWVWIVIMCIGCLSVEGNMSGVEAAQSVKYTYDSLGRVKTATYPGKMIQTYIYDKNGNIREIRKELLESGGEQSNTTETTEAEKPTPAPKPPLVPGSNMDPIVMVDPSGATHNMTEELQAYNQFKKRTPVIKSLKQSKKKKKRYLTIQIRKLKKTGKYPETGYQIQYATNKRFKKAKKVTVTCKKKKSVVSKKWTVKKKKTYYVRIRAYLVTKTGKKIYTKYSKVKKIKVQ